jgi:hypothetical protein
MHTCMVVLAHAAAHTPVRREALVIEPCAAGCDKHALVVLQVRHNSVNGLEALHVEEK